MDKDVNESDPRSNVHYLGSSENKAWKKIQACTGFEPMTSAIPVQRSTNWANKRAAPVSQRSWVQIPYRPEFFSGLIFTTAQVVHITARIIFIPS